MLPHDQKEHLRALFEEFEACETPEARFARTMDNFQPLLLNNANNGGDWRAHDVSKTQVSKRQNNSKKGSEDIWKYSMEIIKNNVNKGNLKDI